ncbi:MAG: DNA helicase PcrA [Eubacteriales bacterium]|nr:DNA helicase PcrA [Eubacteriales bacterium]
MDFLEGLNDKQKEAVLHTEGPLLILAGAGSGKTRVITHRIAYLIKEKGVHPSSILAFTFTNKAANEMKERVEHLVGDVTGDIWVGTFHSTCVRILRVDIDKTKLKRGFAIFDSNDQLSLMKSCLKEMNLDDKLFPPKAMLSEISNAKNELIYPDKFERENSFDFRRAKIAQIYNLYQSKLIENNAMDFDDIIMYTVTLLENNKDVLDHYNRKFKYVHVDEYQDTNTAQFRLISLLAEGSGNLCVVGDDDQSIYAFRGANIRNILEFEKKNPKTAVIKLEQNYRSTKNILNTANSVIAQNTLRRPKKLWTSNEEGFKTYLYLTDNETDEASLVATEIRRLEALGDINFKDAAILYRTNAQSRAIENVFRRENIPYKIVAGTSFYQRMEIKDTVAYLRLINNPSGNVDLKRIINVPKRGIGDATVEKLEEFAKLRGTSMFEVVANADSIPELGRTANKLQEFILMIMNFISVKDDIPVSELVSRVINETGMVAEYRTQDTFEAENRIENMQELISAAIDYEKNLEKQGLEYQGLDEFLTSISLASDVDSIDDENSVLMMTLHSAKGLEFPVVFIVGMEEGLFPGYRSITENEIDEERRLCYVGITRARNRLYLTNTRCRTLFGRTGYNMPSRFLKDIPPELLEGNMKDLNGVESIGVDGAGTSGAEAYRTGAYRPEAYKTGASRTGASQTESAYSVGNSAKGNDSFNGMKLYRGGKPIDLSEFSKGTQVLNFSEGDKVRHKRFGQGVIKSAVKDGDDTVLEIIFEDTGMKRLLASLARLEKI